MKLAGTVMKDPGGYITPQKFKKLFLSAKDDDERAYLLMLWRTGGRISEILAITREDFDFKDFSVVLPNLKKRKADVKTIALDPFTLKFFKEYLAKFNSSEKVFSFDRFKAIRILRKIGKRAGIVRVGKGLISPHKFRHGYSVHAVKSNVPIRTLQAMLGHSNLETTAHYLKLTAKDHREQLKKMWG